MGISNFLAHLVRRDTLWKKRGWDGNVMSCPQRLIHRQDSSHLDFTFMCLILVFSLHAPGLMEMHLLTLHRSNALGGNIFVYAYVGIMYGCWEGKGLSFGKALLRETSY